MNRGRGGYRNGSLEYDGKRVNDLSFNESKISPHGLMKSNYEGAGDSSQGNISRKQYYDKYDNSYLANEKKPSLSGPLSNTCNKDRGRYNNSLSRDNSHSADFPRTNVKGTYHETSHPPSVDFINSRKNQIGKYDRISNKNYSQMNSPLVTSRQFSQRGGSHVYRNRGNFHSNGDQFREGSIGNNSRKMYDETKGKSGQFRNHSNSTECRKNRNLRGKDSFAYGTSFYSGFSRANASNKRGNNNVHQFSGFKDNDMPLGMYWPKLKDDTNPELKSKYIGLRNNDYHLLESEGLISEQKVSSKSEGSCQSTSVLSKDENKQHANSMLKSVHHNCNDTSNQKIDLVKGNASPMDEEQLLLSGKGTYSNTPTIVKKTSMENNQCNTFYKSVEGVTPGSTYQMAVSKTIVTDVNNIRGFSDYEVKKSNISGRSSSKTDMTCGVSEKAIESSSTPSNEIVKKSSLNDKNSSNNSGSKKIGSKGLNANQNANKHKPSDHSNNSPNNNNQKKNKKPKKELVHKTYVIGLNMIDSFDDQALRMISQFEMTPEEKVKLNQLFADLIWIFSPLLPAVKPVLFGSVEAGTAFKNSDVDVCLQCDSLPTESVRSFVATHGNIIHKGGIFKYGVKIPNARVPLIKGVHVSSGISVDVSFRGDNLDLHYGLCNSILVKHLCSHDPRVRNLIMLILFWAKYHNFVGKYQISSFTFILMTIFYLQIVDILPPLYKILKMDDGRTGWPTTFNKDTYLLINNNTDSLESLYLGFFTFYSAVRFNEVVISVFAGELVLGALFDSLDLLPKCYSKYKELIGAETAPPFSRNDMSIQEPFNLSWNTARGVCEKGIQMLKLASQNVCNVFTKFSSLRALSVVHSNYYTAENDEDSYTWMLPCPSELSPSEWFKKVVRATSTIFSTILLMDVRQGAQESHDYKMCKFVFSNALEANPIYLGVSCDYLVACKERDKLLKTFNSLNISEYTKETKASHLCMEDLIKKQKKGVLRASVNISKNDNNGSVEISVNKRRLTGKWKKNEHRQFISYLKDNFTEFLKTTLGLDSPNSNRDKCGSNKNS